MRRRRMQFNGSCYAPIAHEGQGILGEAAFIRRTDTKGGVAPTAGCDAGHISEQVRMRYSALYQFFSAPKS